MTDNNAPCFCGTSGCTSGSGYFCTSAYNRCLATPVCTHTDGTTNNTAPCQCGTSGCTSGSGYYCTASENQCALDPSCTVTDGSVANSAVCQCGTAVCGSGDFCYSPHNVCADYANPRKIGAFTAPACRDGVNTAPCVCGDSSACTGTGAGNTGLVCHAETSTCSRPDSCSKTDGLVKNAASCACGSVDCASEEYCIARFNAGCSQYALCSVTNGSNATGGTCVCGSVDCKTGEYCHYGTEDWLTQWGLCRNSSDSQLC
jgi:hypothetical protein